MENRDLYSRVYLCAQRFLSASHVENLAISIRAPFFERSVFYSRDNLNTRDLYSRAGVCIFKFNNEFFDIHRIIQQGKKSRVVVFFPFVYFESSRT